MSLHVEIEDDKVINEVITDLLVGAWLINCASTDWLHQVSFDLIVIMIYLHIGVFHT